MKFSVFQLSRKGGREKNEDRMGYCYTRTSGLFLLADGMGGHPEGEVAADLALQAMSALYQKEAKPDLEDVPAFLTAALMAAHRRILRYALEKGMTDTPRTTVVAAVLQDGCAWWIHCGDSRLYLVRQGDMLVRTRDHSYSEQRARMGTTTSKSGEPLAAINRNILFTCLGSPTKPVYDVAGPVPLQQGDRILLCSDGLWGNLDDPNITHYLGARAIAHAVPDMVEHALQMGGPSCDNVTVISLEWETPDAATPERGSITTEAINDGGFASTFQSDWQDSVGDDLDDAAIERSIAEINEAIRRTAAKRI
jgi:serine/threonine protein phosphatase PrpC